MSEATNKQTKWSNNKLWVTHSPKTGVSWLGFMNRACSEPHARHQGGCLTWQALCPRVWIHFRRTPPRLYLLITFGNRGSHDLFLKWSPGGGGNLFVIFVYFCNLFVIPFCIIFFVLFSNCTPPPFTADRT